MHLHALGLLACPRCGSDLVLQERGRSEGGHLMSGALTCTAPACATRYPILGGVPRLVPGRVHAGASETAARFGQQWKTFAHMSDYQERWLAGWLAPLGAADFRGRTVFEGGCGKGRHTVVMAERWGVQDIVALDLGDAVEVAFGHTRHLSNAHVVQGDLLNPPVKRAAFDAAFSIGVLHHLPDPRAGFDALRSTVREGGRVAIWVYGFENNEWIVRFVNPLRERVTARMPSGLLQALTLAPSAALTAWTRLYTLPGLGEHLPYCAYMRQLASLPLREVHNIVFDQLVTPIAFYLREQEVREWLAVPGLHETQVEHHNKNSWRAHATVSLPSPVPASLEGTRKV